jgi:hypothetical protein
MPPSSTRSPPAALRDWEGASRAPSQTAHYRFLGPSPLTAPAILNPCTRPPDIHRPRASQTAHRAAAFLRSHTANACHQYRAVAHGSAGTSRTMKQDPTSSLHHYCMPVWALPSTSASNNLSRAGLLYRTTNLWYSGPWNASKRSLGCCVLSNVAPCRCPSSVYASVTCLVPGFGVSDAGNSSLKLML